MVGGENLVRDDRRRLSLRNGRTRSGSAACTARLRGEDDISGDPVATARAGHLREHGQTDRDPEDSHDRERYNSRQEPGARTGTRAWRTNASWTIDVRVPQDSLLWPPQASDGR